MSRGTRPRGVGRGILTGAILCALVLLSLAAGGASAATPRLSFKSVKVVGNVSPNLPWTEPRITVAPGDVRWIVTNSDKNNNVAVAASSRDGLHWTLAPSPIAGQTSATPDVDVVAMHTGRILASELDDAGINFPTSYTDNQGRTWTQSTGSTQAADQDRQWFAVGPDDPVTHKPRIYFLFHNLFSGEAQHEMWVATSTDGGASFGAPVPVAPPGSPAYLDLQCADSGGPSAIWVNQRDGTIYAEFTTRATPTDIGLDTGGCTPPATGQPFEFNIVAATRVWLAQSTDGGKTWTDSLAVDDAKTGQIVSMQVASGGLDRAGNVYVAYPEGPLGRQYPDYSGAGVRYRWAPPARDGNLKWSAPKTLVPANKSAPGNVLVHMQAGDPGRLIAEYWRGFARPGKEPVWHMTASETTNALSANPHVIETRVSNVPTDTGTASELMGACTNEGPITGIVNGLACGRSPDVWGVTADSRCRANSVWPAVDAPDNPKDTSSNPKRVPGNSPGTWVSLQTGGPSLCGGGGGQPLVPGGCPDRSPPQTTFVKNHPVGLRGNHLTVKGTSSDAGCVSANLIPGTGRVDRVLVSVAKVRGGGTGNNCAFLSSRGKLGGFKNCRRPVLIPARGTTKWQLSVPFSPRLPRGKYRIVARGIDASGNKEKPNAFRNTFNLTAK